MIEALGAWYLANEPDIMRGVVVLLVIFFVADFLWKLAVQRRLNNLERNTRWKVGTRGVDRRRPE